MLFRSALVAKTETWGITVISVEMRDIIIPKGLQDALSREAQAERERSARITLAEVEEDISEMFVRAARNYEEEESALRLRAIMTSGRRRTTSSCLPPIRPTIWRAKRSAGSDSWK